MFISQQSTCEYICTSNQTLIWCRPPPPQLVQCFPAQWFTGMTGQKTLPQLEPLCRYLTHVASTLYRGSLAASDLERRSLK